MRKNLLLCILNFLICNRVNELAPKLWLPQWKFPAVESMRSRLGQEGRVDEKSFQNFGLQAVTRDSSIFFLSMVRLGRCFTLFRTVAEKARNRALLRESRELPDKGLYHGEKYVFGHRTTWSGKK